jgi:uncharacterized protein (DUF2225 family)
MYARRRENMVSFNKVKTNNSKIQMYELMQSGYHLLNSNYFNFMQIVSTIPTRWI